MSGPVRVFFFSSRRRHTRLQGDWSSDVCSSDLQARRLDLGDQLVGVHPPEGLLDCLIAAAALVDVDTSQPRLVQVLEQESRSEERRVGKESRGGGRAGRWKRKGTAGRG